MPFIRDYIPAGEDMTAEERAAYDAARARIEGGVIHDFVPPEGWVPHVPRPLEESIREAELGAEKRMKDAGTAAFEDAKARLRLMTVSEAVEYMRQLPIGLLELYIAAEEVIGGRRGILDNFPGASAELKESLGVTKVTAAPKAPPARKAAAREE